MRVYGLSVRESVSLTIWKPKEELLLSVEKGKRTRDVLQSRIWVAKGQLDAVATKAEPSERVNDLIGEADEGQAGKGLVHVIVQINAPSQPPTQDAVSFAQQRRQFFVNNPKSSPSSESYPENFHIAQQSETSAVFCGRPFGATTPPSLLDETLCKLRYDITNITPSPTDKRCFQSLHETASLTFEHEGERQVAFTDVLIKGDITPNELRRRHTWASYDTGNFHVRVLGYHVLFYIQNVKHEVCASDSDPYVQAARYYLEQVRDFMEHCTRANEEMMMNFPAILALHFGPYLAIAAAAYTNKVIVEHLACIPLHMHSTNLAEIQAGERVLAALRVALPALRDQYLHAPDNARPRADFPFRDFYEDGNGRRHYFIYEKAIDEKRVFRVHLKDDPERTLCVKFSVRYSEAAHRAASDLNLAPALCAVNKVFDWYMIVMEDMSAEYTTLFNLRYCRSVATSRLEEAQKEVIAKLGSLHERGFVHGDARDANVLVRNEDAPGERPYVLLVDWDWAGSASDATYPPTISRIGIPRPFDALGGERIIPEHDMWMAECLLAV
ncbi:hypothetical protein WOLCODRAFT_102647 [Wolfiporia cocos MD-104 SS10]|uniref:Protein kinase domain-containing protein n=1 Tax=Wolfiporia cocos (strain MD-104) TaxID=742152 RepID=A0A2H3JY75_WOLCO|nr:hypothetical protein WOLCODRAFT_102647 [Wolfiporia cocos MD-104 SS10]